MFHFCVFMCIFLNVKASGKASFRTVYQLQVKEIDSTHLHIYIQSKIGTGHNYHIVSESLPQFLSAVYTVFGAVVDSKGVV